LRALNLDAARRWWPLAVGVLLGVLVGLLVSLLGSGTRRAEATVLISSPAGPAAVRPMLPNLRELATSGVVAGNVQSTLRLAESTEGLRRHLHASVRQQSEVIAISATDKLSDRARQVAQEAAVVFAQLVDARFGAGKPELHAEVLDSAHVLGGPDRHLVRNGLIGGLVGLLLGSAAMFVLASGTHAVADDHPDLRQRERLLEQRVKNVTARESALAGHAGKLAARERALDDRAAKLTATERELTAAPRPPPLSPSPEPLLAPEPEAPPALAARAGAWNLNDLQRALDAHTGASPEQADEWRAYLFFLRDHASSDGSLPRSFDPLIADVFAEVVARRTSS
jgi:hypothetical protein